MKIEFRNSTKKEWIHTLIACVIYVLALVFVTINVNTYYQDAKMALPVAYVVVSVPFVCWFVWYSRRR